MKIGIHNEPAGGGIGGTESAVAMLAEALRERHEVEIVHHRRSLTLEALAKFSGSSMSGVRLRYVEREPRSSGGGSLSWRDYQGARRWHADLSKPYDVFINYTHNVPPFCHAPRGILVVLFPLEMPPWKRDGLNNGAYLREGIRHLYDRWEWKRRFKTYEVKTAISHFSRTWTRRWWGIDCQVLYPPVDNSSSLRQKENLIVSAGRFTSLWGGMKKQREMVRAFRDMTDGPLHGWEYCCVGGLSDAPEDRAYFADVARLAASCGARVVPNVERAYLKDLYDRSKIFWHGAGYGDDERGHPEMAEHFGITTVEAMAGGCVPVAIKKGAQPEVIQHGVNGFLWNTLEELKHYTLVLARDEELREGMSEAARRRAQDFSQDAFERQFLALCDGSG